MNVMMGSSLLLNSAGYQISRSVRLRSAAGAWFSRTAGVPTNQFIWVVSFWTKIAQGGAFIGGGTTTPNWLYTEFGSTGMQMYYPNTGAQMYLASNALFRDPSAWYHVVLAFDSTQATPSNRVKFYVNGNQLSLSATTYPGLNTTFFWNQNGLQQRIGSITGAGGNYDGYLADFYGIDGQSLPAGLSNWAQAFGETNPATGVWQPKKYTGTYGTNGFYLNFSDPSAATAAAIGADRSGNGNNWTPNNISVTAGVTYDSMLDVPTPWPDGGNGRGNYAVLNPLQKGSVITVSAGNLQFASSSGNSYCPSTIGATTGKWYCEVFMTSVSTAAIVGIVNENASLATYPGGNANGYGYFRDGQKYTNGSGSAYGNSYTDNDIIGIALDLDNGKVWFSKNGTWQASGDPAAGTNAAFTGISATNTWFFACGNSGVTTQNANFGQRPFAYTPPSGFRALNTQNLPTPTIANGANYFAATTYTGTGASRSVDNTVNNVSFQPDFVWVKGRSGATDHALYDAVRGVQKQWETNTTTAETTETTGLTAFNSNGFTVGALAQMNTNTATYVGWQWKEGATQGFDIVLYTGNSTASRSVNHNLGVTPSMIFVKNRTTAQNNPVAHTSLAVGNLLLFDTTGASTAAGTRLRLGNSTAFTVGDAADYTITNQTGNDYVAYCFAAIAGFSAFGSYTGNGSTDGTFVFCGFRPRFVMFKRSDAASAWTMYDTARDLFNPEQNYIQAQSSAAEAAAVTFDILANGFKLRTTGDPNVSGGTYIFAAFAENPFKYALAR
jgi:hypothetical protein